MSKIQTALRKAIAWPYIGRALGALVLFAAALLVWRKRQAAVKQYRRAVQDVLKARARKADAVTEADDARARQQMIARQAALAKREQAMADERAAKRERDRLMAQIDRAESPKAIADELNRLLGL